MVLLGALDLVKPEIGLVFWTFIVFLAIWIILGKTAFGPIGRALKKREESISDALKQADLARAEMANLQADNEKLLLEAREERSKMLKEAKEIKENILREAKDDAKKQADRMIEEAKREIDNRRLEVLTEVKNQTGKLAVEIAEKLIRKQLEDPKAQAELAGKMVADFKMN